jgi:hypothetical protein
VKTSNLTNSLRLDAGGRGRAILEGFCEHSNGLPRSMTRDMLSGFLVLGYLGLFSIPDKLNHFAHLVSNSSIRYIRRVLTEPQYPSSTEFGKRLEVAAPITQCGDRVRDTSAHALDVKMNEMLNGDKFIAT